ncbi:hypothetical protein GLAREA_07573 [Glarea lozoyensis ATCC 20868]|uniref:Clr5 domain-containing protein n=1 Tax=Glarea lozoyensis (strain ATCC 20868 / MF5171) TaxID=1116229 RepID=S3D3S1_GLAL2|nr:uncharacterized protein GLAREA_07573 [Glarea lozoyensis ATCC 20868]EPE32440.1 hypothetical protein GLAREA_07573 [Glarea lozoyensis ATCC 20868]
MRLSILAPRPGGEPVTLIVSRPHSAQVYDESEWATAYPEIERLYIRERRKLRYIIQFMEKKHGFKATEQMYKKRFAKWGFQKSTRRSTTDVQRLSRRLERCRNSKSHSPVVGEPCSILMLPLGLGPNDSLKLMFFTSVRTWSVAFFDGLQTIRQRAPLTVEAQEISFAFKLSIDLLNRGHGMLAGRTIRKAFLLIEDLFTLESPALIWNLLEIMYNMVLLNHRQLFQMLLVHLIALAKNYRMPEAHPLSTMLQALWRLAEDRRDLVPSSSPSLWSSLSGSSTSGGTIIAVDTFSHAFLFLLEQAWISNAQILFDHFDPELIQLYWSLLWDSCSIKLPVAVVDPVVQWLSQTNAASKKSAAAATHPAQGNPFELQHRLTPHTNAHASPLHGNLRASSIALLRERWDLILENGVDSDAGSGTLLGILAGLVATKVLEERPDIMLECSLRPGRDVMKAPRIQAVPVACVIMAASLMSEVNIVGAENTDASSTSIIERLRMVVSLREYLQGEADPQVVRELWLLEDAFNGAGEHEQAQEVKRESFRRLEIYVQNIPAMSA